MAKNIIPSSRKIPFTKEDMKDIIRYNQELHKSGYTLPPFRNISMPVQTKPMNQDVGYDAVVMFPECDDDQHDDGPHCGTGESLVDPEAAKLAADDYPPGFGPLDTAPIDALSQQMSRAAVVSLTVNRTADDCILHEMGRWSGSIEVPPSFHGRLIGTKAAGKIEMEKGTGCRIIFPDREARSPLIRVSSVVGWENVSRCLDRIEASVLAKQKSDERQPFVDTTTHFAAFPCNHPRVQDRFLTFMDMIDRYEDSADESCRNPSLFPSQLKLHVTICMLQLQTEEAKMKLRSTLALLNERHKKSFPLLVTIEGLEIMNDDPAETHVLFAKVKGEGLQEIADDMRNELLQAGLISKGHKDTSVKLHMTLMNSRYATEKDENGNFLRHYGMRKPFDTTLLLQEHGGFEFGFFKLNHLTICTLQTEDAKDGYYTCHAIKKMGELVIKR